MTEVEKTKPPNRGRGRPPLRSDDETLAIIIAAAREEFLASGYAGTTICNVAQRASISTKTLYKLVPAKDVLFEMVISDRIARFILEIDSSTIGVLGLEEGLEHILFAYGRLAFDRKSIDMTRLVYGESVRFPEIGRAFYDAAVKRISEAITRWLQEQCGKGALELEDAQTAASLLAGMMIMEPQRAAMMGQSEASDLASIENRAKICARIFLSGCRRKIAGC